MLAPAQLHTGVAAPSALTSGFQWGFWALAAISFAAAVATLTLVRREQLAPEAEAAQAVI
jgi:hypothetical protein